MNALHGQSANRMTQLTRFVLLSTIGTVLAGRVVVRKGAFQLYKFLGFRFLESL